LSSRALKTSTALRIIPTAAKFFNTWQQSFCIITKKSIAATSVSAAPIIQLNARQITSSIVSANKACFAFKTKALLTFIFQWWQTSAIVIADQALITFKVFITSTALLDQWR